VPPQVRSAGKGGTTAASFQGDGEIQLDAEVHVNRGDFGLTWNWMGMVAMNSTLTVHAVFTQLNVDE